MFSRIAHNRQDDQTDKQRTQSNLVGQRLDGAHQHLTHDRRDGRHAGEDDDGKPERGPPPGGKGRQWTGGSLPSLCGCFPCKRRCVGRVMWHARLVTGGGGFACEHVNVGGVHAKDRVGDVGRVTHQQDDGHSDAELMQLAAAHHGIPGARALAHRCQQRWDGHADHRQGEHGCILARYAATKPLPPIAPATHEHRRAQHEQRIADDGASQRGPHHLRQTCGQRSQADDDFGRVAEGRVQETTDAMPQALGQDLSGEADQPGERDESQCRQHKGHQGRRMQGLGEDRRWGCKYEQIEPAIHDLSVSHVEGWQERLAVCLLWSALRSNFFSKQVLIPAPGHEYSSLWRCRPPSPA